MSRQRYKHTADRSPVGGGRQRLRSGARDRRASGISGDETSGTKIQSLIGELKLHRDGYGFVVADKPGVEDVFVPARSIGDALHTDIVEVKLSASRRESPEGRIVRIVERRMKKLVGRLENVGHGFRVIATDNRVRRQIKVLPQHLSGAAHGDEVVVVIMSYPEGDKPLCGVVEKVIAGRGNLDAEEEVIITQHQLPTHFPEAVEREAHACAASASFEIHGDRRDLTHIDFITIDGENARDFDDAVAAERLSGGIIRLRVSIADVSEYVLPGSAIDNEAYQRGTSVYFPQRCLPMLPEVLSNDLCSLRPDLLRLTMTAELDIDPRGRIQRTDFYPSVIKSRRRMTYTEIKQILIDRDESVRRVHAELLDAIHLMEECFQRLRIKRQERGSLDFDLPEPEIVMDIEGGIETIVRAERHTGHMMIEEFMVAANEAVAETLTNAHRGCIYRVHEHPSSDKLREFALFMHNLGYHVRIGERVVPGRLARIIAQVRGRPEERIVNHKLLRSMSQAVYSVENIGHYGLASECYCHFTSPIRRYPDLVVHRLLKSAIARGASMKQSRGAHLNRDGVAHASHSGNRARTADSGDAKELLIETAQHCSRRERVAMQAERQMAKLYAALFMREHVGETFKGVVSHIAKFGFFVELEEFFVEGLIRLADLVDDFYRFDEQGMRLVGKRRKRVIRIGDRALVRVEEVNIAGGEVVFELCEHNP